MFSAQNCTRTVHACSTEGCPHLTLQDSKPNSMFSFLTSFFGHYGSPVHVRKRDSFVGWMQTYWPMKKA